MTDPQSQSSPVRWPDDGPPRSRLNGDVYFSRDDGLAEARTVFLGGCGLPEAWEGRRRFTVGELGFGTGLNIAALLELWARTRRPGQRLQVFTIESRPLAVADAARALSMWPELAPVAKAMTDRWPGRARGFHRMDLPDLSATVDVAILEAAEALEAWRGAADAWFLDGFSPALTADAADDIWRPAVLELVARRSAPGARAATYTIAGAIRRNLAAAGFEVERAPGHGRKRERLQARWPGAATDAAPPRVAIVGAGIAGASLARAFRALDVLPRVFDEVAAGAGASGAAAALMAPRLDAGLAAGAALFAQAARRAARLYEEAPGAVIARGALQLAQGPKDPRRFATIAGSPLFEPDDMTPLSREDASGRLGESAQEGLWMDRALTVRPGAILAAWLGPTVRARVAAVRRAEGAWRLLDAEGLLLAEADVVCLACGMGAGVLAPGLGLTAVRGQATLAEGTAPGPAASFGAYAIPAGADTVFFGATHDRNDEDARPRPEDQARNLGGVAAALPILAGRLRGGTLRDWCAIRATTQDYLPLAGAAPGWPAGLFVLSGLGSRGFCLAPLLAEHLAAVALGAASPLPRPLADLTDPARFAARAARKGRPATPVAPQDGRSES